MAFKPEFTPQQEPLRDQAEKSVKVEEKDQEKEAERVSGKKKMIEGLISLRKQKIELNKLVETLNTGVVRDPETGEVVEVDDDEFYTKTVLLPKMVAWTERREREGKDVSFLEFIKEEDLSNLDLDIIIDELEKYDGKEEPVTMGREAMLNKAHTCSDLRSEAHKILAEIGEIDPSMKSIKMEQLEEDFNEWLDRFFERLGTKIELWSSGIGVLEGVFTKFWDGQGTIDKMFAKLNKKRMGLIEHTFMLRGIARRIEMVVDFLDKSDNAKEVRHYTSEIKGYMKLLVGWNNEYQRLHRSSSNFSINEVYKNITEKSDELDKLAITEIYPDKEGKRGFEGSSELDPILNRKKKEICDALFTEIKTKFPDAKNRADEMKKERNRYGGPAPKDVAEGLKAALNAERIFNKLSRIIDSINKETHIQDLSKSIDSLKISSHQEGFESSNISELDRLVADASMIGDEKQAA
jgi:hypothetical protein